MHTPWVGHDGLQVAPSRDNVHGEPDVVANGTPQPQYKGNLFNVHLVSMDANMGNPFDHQNPSSPQDFLDRDAERTELKTWLASGRNVLVFGPRRRGKTSLLSRVLSDLDPDQVGVLVDVYGCNDETDVAQRILDAFSATGLAKSKRFKKWVAETAQSIDEVEIALTKAGPSVRVHRGQRNRDTLTDCWAFLNRTMKGMQMRLVLALDEFQDIMPIPNLTKTMRRLNQASRHIQLLLSGSIAATLRSLNEDHDSPFYQQLTMKEVRGLTIQDLRQDADKRLPRKLSDNDVDAIKGFCGDDTHRVVQVLRHHYDLQDAVKAIAATLWENRIEYELLLKRVKRGNQRRTLYAMAHDQPKHPTGGAFLIKHRLGAPENVRNAIKALQDLEILDEDGCTFLDPTFRQHLLRQQTSP